MSIQHTVRPLSMRAIPLSMAPSALPPGRSTTTHEATHQGPELAKRRHQLATAIRRDKGLLPAARLVGQELVAHVGNAGCAWPSHQYLADILGLDVRTVEKAIKALVAGGDCGHPAGYFRRERSGRGYRYWPVWVRGAAGDADPIPGQNEGSHAATPGQNEGDQSATPGRLGSDTPHSGRSIPGLNEGLPLKRDIKLSLSPPSPPAEPRQREREPITFEGKGPISFPEFWLASGQKGKRGPAEAAWLRLTDSERLEISDLVRRQGHLDTGDRWGCVWLQGKGWRDLELPSQSAGSNEMLAPYSPEWHAERERMVEAGEPTSFMDTRGKLGKAWQRAAVIIKH